MGELKRRGPAAIPGATRDPKMHLTSRRRQTAVFAYVASICSMPFIGCGGSGNDYQAVSGVVTFQGKPIQEGAIQFFTLGDQPVVCGGAMIRDGAYELPRDHGLPPGAYLVRISWPERIPIPEEEQDPMNPFRTRELIPAKFNTESQLKIDVRSDQPAQFNFDLE